MTNSPSKKSHLGADLITLWVLAMTAVVIGLLINQFRDQRLPLVYQGKEERMMKSVEKIARKAAPAVAADDGIFPESLSLEEFQVFVEEKRGPVLDARPEIFHRLGHVPGAISLPREDFEAAFTANRAVLEPMKNAPIAVYCSSASCEDSKLVRKALAQLGFTKVGIFDGGWSAWTGAGLPEESKN